MLAGLQRFGKLLGVPMIGREHAHHVHFGPIEQLTIICRGEFHAKLARREFEARGIGIGDGSDGDRRLGIAIEQKRAASDSEAD